ncbi:MAG: hypothetical protein YPKNTGVA_000352 [Candidatus Fervidibacter sp.]|jgi:hypothetical protein
MEMASPSLMKVMQEAEKLSLDEQWELALWLMERLRQRVMASRPHWKDLAGIAPDLLEGMDAQTWVSQGRRESDEHRSQQWGEQFDPC